MERIIFNNGLLFSSSGTFRKGAIIVEGDHIAAVFQEGETLPNEVANANTIDFDGRFVLPGFVDAHFHLRSLALKSLRCDLGSADSVEEVLDLLSEWPRSEESPFVVGVDWDESRWPDRQFPTRDMLDAAEPNRPVFIRRICGHIGVVNSAFSKLLEAKGAHVNSKTGVIEEDAVWTAGRLSSPDDTSILKSFKGAIEQLHQLGITEIHDIIEPNQFDIYLRGIEQAGKPLRINGYVVTVPSKLNRYREASKSMDGAYFKIMGVKVFLDGSIGGWTAALHESYSDSPRNGEILMAEDRLERTLRDCHDLGFTCAIHAIGDHAVRTVLRHLVDYPKEASCFRIEHAEVIGPNELDLLIKAPVYLVMQPNFIRNWGGPGGLYESRLGPDRAKYCNRFRTLSNAGVQYCFSSDGMPPGPLYGLKGATHHPVPDERIPAAEALFRYSTTSHQISLDRRGGGGIEPGNLADFIVLSGNPLEMDTDEISVLKTFIGGRIVYHGA